MLAPESSRCESASISIPFSIGLSGETSNSTWEESDPPTADRFPHRVLGDDFFDEDTAYQIIQGLYIIATDQILVPNEHATVIKISKEMVHVS